MKRTRRRGENSYPSLYDYFNLGDRVVRTYKDKSGNAKEYRGIIMAIRDDSMEIYWDTMNGKYRPKEMNVAFTTCKINEIFNGNKYYSPLEKE